jgi:uncharacterized protein YjdB
MQMSASVYPNNADNKGVGWSVENPDYARISQEGLLTPLKSGTVTVTATALDGSGVTGSKQIIIRNQEILVTSLSLDTATKKYSVKTGNQITIVATVSPSGASNKKLAWSIDDSSLATIDSNGILTAGYTSKKSVIVTARTTDGSGLFDTIEIQITN